MPADAPAKDVARKYLSDRCRRSADGFRSGIFSEIKPANTLVVVADLIGDYRVEIEIEAEAVMRPGP